MTARDFGLLLTVCFIWAAHTIVSKLAVSDLAIPPLWYAAIRYLLVAALAFPWLLPLPRPIGLVALVSFLMGGGSFALFFIGIGGASPSAAAVVLQLGLPFTTLLSVLLLGERIGWRRGLGIALTFAGAVLVMFDPDGFRLSAGLLAIAGSAFAGSLGAVLMKRTSGVSPMQFQAWVGLVGSVPLLALSAVAETGQIARSVEAGAGFAAAVLFSAVVVSIGAHSLYYRLIFRYEANLVAPLMLLSPLMTVGLGVAITGDELGPRMIVGAVMALTGVLVITRRPARRAPIATPASDGLA